MERSLEADTHMEEWFEVNRKSRWQTPVTVYTCFESMLCARMEQQSKLLRFSRSQIFNSISILLFYWILDTQWMNEIFILDSRYYLLSILKRVFQISPFPKRFKRYYSVMFLPAYCTPNLGGTSETRMKIFFFLFYSRMDSPNEVSCGDPSMETSDSLPKLISSRVPTAVASRLKSTNLYLFEWTWILWDLFENGIFENIPRRTVSYFA